MNAIKMSTVEGAIQLILDKVCILIIEIFYITPQCASQIILVFFVCNN